MSTGCSEWCRKSRRKMCTFFSTFMCVFEDTHRLMSLCVQYMVVCVLQRLMGCWGPPLVEANIREQATYYYWSTPGQNNNPCVSRYCFLILVMDSAGPPLIRLREGVRERNDGNMEIQREKYWPAGTKTKSNKEQETETEWESKSDRKRGKQNNREKMSTEHTPNLWFVYWMLLRNYKSITARQSWNQQDAIDT